MLQCPECPDSVSACLRCTLLNGAAARPTWAHIHWVALPQQTITAQSVLAQTTDVPLLARTDPKPRAPNSADVWLAREGELRGG